jgi:transcriptional regulator with XRE-family HTH domain
MEFKVALGDVIRELRLERSLTLRTLSKRSNVALSYLSDIERGRKDPSSSVMSAIGNGLKVPIHQIVIEAGYRMGEWDVSGIADSQALREIDAYGYKMSVGRSNIEVETEERELV